MWTDPTTFNQLRQIRIKSDRIQFNQSNNTNRIKVVDFNFDQTLQIQINSIDSNPFQTPPPKSPYAA